MSKVVDFFVKNIFEVPISFYKKHGIKYILSDLDNTLDAYDVSIPSSRVINLKEELETNNIKLIIISNNKGKRVSLYSNSLKVNYLANACKPFGNRLRRYLKDNNIPLEECLFVGDQLTTDVNCAKSIGVKVMLTDPLVKKDQLTTRFNRLFDKPRRKRLIKKGILNYLKEEDYE